MDYLTKLPNAVFDALEFLGSWLAVLWKADALPEFDLLLKVAIIGAVWMGSAFLAATIAEMAGRGMFLHFCGGLIFPYIYPIVLLFRLKRVEKDQEQYIEISAEIKKNAMSAKLRRISEEREEARRLRRGGAVKPEDVADSAEDNIPDFSQLSDGAAQQEEDMVIGQEAGHDTAASAEAQEPQAVVSGITRRYIESIAVDSTGNRTGPFAIKMKDGRVLNALSIRGIQDELAVFEIETSNGAKSIRLRYDAIESCDPNQ